MAHFSWPKIEFCWPKIKISKHRKQFTCEMIICIHNTLNTLIKNKHIRVNGMQIKPSLKLNGGEIIRGDIIEIFKDGKKFRSVIYEYIDGYFYSDKQLTDQKTELPAEDKKPQKKIEAPKTEAKKESSEKKK